MLARLKAAIIVLLVLAWPDLGAAQSCVQSGIAAGGDHTCAFTVGGSVVCWGEDQFGQLGNGAFFVATQVPVVVTDPSGQPLGGLRKIAAGYFHTCAISGTCVASACYCPPGRTLCPPSGSSHVCADTASDPNNCGKCGTGMLWGKNLREQRLRMPTRTDKLQGPLRRPADRQ
ncbi:MAG TPA: hypothetical protein VIH87_01220 [Methylocella sp.]